MSDKSVLEQIKHYQRDIIKCPENSKRMIRCIERLFVLPVTISHLQETGIGRSVNELRKYGGEVGAAANALVCKWKCMVKEEEEDDDEDGGSEVDSDAEIKEDTANPASSASRGNKYHRNERSSNTKYVTNKDVQKNHSSNSEKKKKSILLSPQNSSPKKIEHKSSRSEYRSKEKLLSEKECHTSKPDLKPSSSRSKPNEKNHKLEKYSSEFDSEYKCNGGVKKSMKEKHVDGKSVPSENYNKNKLQKYSSSDKGTLVKPSHKSTKRDHPKVNTSSSDEDEKYTSRFKKRKTSEFEEKKEPKKEYSNESHSKTSNTVSEMSNSDSECSEVDRHSKRKAYETNHKSESESEESERSEDNFKSSDRSGSDKNSEGVSEDDRRPQSNSSEEEEVEEEDESSSEKNIYVPVKIKKEKLSPPRDLNLARCESNKITHKNVRSSNINSTGNQTNCTKKEDKFKNAQTKTERNEDKRTSKYHESNRSSSHKKHDKVRNSTESSNNGERISKSVKNVKIKIEKEEDGSIDCESGASFADALLGLSDANKKSLKRKPSTPEKHTPHHRSDVSSKERSSHKSESRSSHSSSRSNNDFEEPDLLKKTIKLEPLDVDLNSTLPEISPHYKPLPHFSPPRSPASKKIKYLSQEEALSTIMSTKNQRTKVYSGNKSGYAKVPSLFDLCIQILRDHIDALEYTGGVPYDLLKPVLDRATADQLYQLEHYNPYLVEDTDGLWQFHCNKDFRGKKPEEFETWRELYLRCLDEREKKLEALKTNISQSLAQSTPVRKTKLAYVDSVVKPPRNVAKQQMKFGTARAVKHEIVSKAVVGAASSSGSATPTAVPVPAPSRPHLAQQPFPIPNFLPKKKKAPLMAKALQLIKGNRFKR